MMRPVGGHYIRPNHSSRMPRRHVIIDTETYAAGDSVSMLQTWRCAVASFCELRPDGTWRVERYDYEDPKILWLDIAGFTGSRKRTVVWAHNLAFDLRISDALACLDKLGFELIDIRLSDQGTWAHWSHNDNTLVAVDSFSVWPVPLAQLGATFGMGKLPSPEEDDDEGWLERCRGDVDILTRAVTTYLSWLKESDIGNWKMTGSGQAWGHWRHRYLTHRVLISDDFGNREIERKAMWTGRAEAWIHGADTHSRVFDWDFANAYARIARDCELPVAQWSISRAVSLDVLLNFARRFAVLAEVQVSTEVPVVPAMLDGRVVWPTGTFDTVLWDPELRLLREAGARVRTGRVWLYRRAPVLRSWAECTLDSLHAPDEVVPAWRKIIHKHHSRALIGRFAMRFQEWEPFAHSETFDLRTFDGWDLDRNESIHFLQVGHSVRKLGGWQEGPDAFPALTGWVMSEARRRLWTVIRIAGEQNVLYIDTDSLLVNQEGNDRLAARTGYTETDGLRMKRRFVGYAIAGPRQLILGDEPRIAGVPKKARRVQGWQFEGEVWRGFLESMRHGEADAVRTTSRTFTVAQVDNRRVGNGEGPTEPIRIDQAG
jgi:hypothetical protein